MHNIKKVVVVGGGTAGWLAALYIQRYFSKQDLQITVIESSKIDIIGVGESTTPTIITLLGFLGISLSDIVFNCGATIKNSIKFTNWNGDGKYFHHGFGVRDPDLSFYRYSNNTPFSDYDDTLRLYKQMLPLKEIISDKNLDGIHIHAALSDEYKVPWVFNENHIPGRDMPFDLPAISAVHFNARHFSAYLKQVGVSRGIEVIDGVVSSARTDDHGFITDVVMEEGRRINCDFVFDCSGLHRVFVNKVFKSPFKSYKNHLPVKKAIPFFIDNKSKVPPFTEAISMKNGWMWKIPVKDTLAREKETKNYLDLESRFGCGYVFDSDYITPDQALQEVKEVLGFEPEIPKVISFDSGYHISPWNKNVLAIGLASGFIEPLEATSIWLTCNSLLMLSNHIAGVLERDEKAIEEYNKEFIKNTDAVLDLVYIHYINSRNDTPFWKEFRSKNTHPPGVAEILDTLKYRMLSMADNTRLLYPAAVDITSWAITCAGNKLFSKEVIEKEYRISNADNFLFGKDLEFKKNMSEVVSRCMDHEKLLKYMVDSYV